MNRFLRYLTVFALILFVCTDVCAQRRSRRYRRKPSPLQTQLSSYFENYVNAECNNLVKIEIEDIKIRTDVDSLKIFLNESFGFQPFTPVLVDSIYQNVRTLLPAAYTQYNLTIYADGKPIEALVRSDLQEVCDSNRLYHGKTHECNPWVTPMSLPYSIDKGLQNRHLCVWASHGKYYNIKKQEWIWQRPRLFCTREDLFTQTFVVPYLIPMLENAGAVVFTPRERDWQKNETIVDNDRPQQGGFYQEINNKYSWEDAGTGFAHLKEFYQHAENPFMDGTCRAVRTVRKGEQQSGIVWQPTIPREGDYAVYVSYKTLPTSVPDAEYIVRHQGVESKFRVNQQMGGGTWVYLGTFHFSAGNTDNNLIYLSNESSHDGHITADAIRIGGGMSNILRCDDQVGVVSGSGLPRFLEAARYSAQWYGFPDTVYSAKERDDYGDDIIVRPGAENYLAKGSYYFPGDSGLCVPLELSLAVHSDAGFRADNTFVGSLGVYTSKFYEGITAAGLSRLTSRDLLDMVMWQVTSDIKAEFGVWNRRQMYDRNYGETRVPQFPSIILEMLSHQNWADMKMAHDPYFKFILSRAVYKGILRYIYHVHQLGTPVVQPLPVTDMAAISNPKDKLITVSWKPSVDKTDSTAVPTHYILYTAIGDKGFDNGTLISAENTAVQLEAEPQKLYRFRVAAVNEGGRSMLGDEVCACISDESTPHLLMVDGFQRVAGPLPVDNDSTSGFRMDIDAGVVDVKSPGYSGYQQYFNKDGYGKESEVGMGYSGEELEGLILAGNTHNYSTLYAQDILATYCFNISSCSSSACATIPTSSFNLINLILGAQKDDSYSLRRYKTFTPEMCQMLRTYTQNAGNVLVSGAYVASDMMTEEDVAFTRDVLKYQFAGVQKTDSICTVQGMNTKFSIYCEPNEENYWIRSADVLEATGGGFCAMLYENNNFSAATAYNGSDYHVMAFGFPLECIQETETRRSILYGAVQFLINR